MYTRRTLKVALHFGQLTTTRGAGTEPSVEFPDTGSIAVSGTDALVALIGKPLLDVLMIALARVDHSKSDQ